MEVFSVTTVDDRRVTPSHGYRAVHVIVSLHERAVEIQIRTREQDSWAQLSERLSDDIDPAIKYGGGPQDIRKGLLGLSSFLASVEPLEESLTETESRMLALESGAHHYAPTEPEFQLLAQEYRDKEAALRRLKQDFARILLEFRERLAR